MCDIVNELHRLYRWDEIMAGLYFSTKYSKASGIQGSGVEVHNVSTDDT